MKKILSIALLASVSATTIFAANISDNNNNYSTTLELIRSQNIDKLLERINALESYTVLYMYQTGDIYPTTNKVARYFKLPSSAVANFTNGQIQISANNNNYKFTFSHLFQSLPTQDLINMEKVSTKLQPTASVNLNGDSIVIPYPAQTIQFVSIIKNLPKGSTVVSMSAPRDITKIWYQPNGKGDFNVYQYSSGRWVNIGGMKKDGFVVSSKADLNKLTPIVTIGAKAYVKDGSQLDTYIFNGSTWDKINVDANNNGEVYNSSSMPACNASTKGKIIYVKDSSGSVKQDICDGAGHWLDLNARSELEKKLYSDKSALPKCSADLSGMELFVKKDTSAVGYVCNGKGDWMASAGSGSGNNGNNIPAGAVIIPGVWGQQNFDDTSQFKGIINTSTPFCDSANPHHCFKNWNDFANKNDVYKKIAPFTYYTSEHIYTFSGTKWYKMKDFKQVLIYFWHTSEWVTNWTKCPYGVTRYKDIFKDELDEGDVKDAPPSPPSSVDPWSYPIFPGYGLTNKHEAGPDVWYKPKGSPAP